MVTFIWLVWGSDGRFPANRLTAKHQTKGGKEHPKAFVKSTPQEVHKAPPKKKCAVKIIFCLPQIAFFPFKVRTLRVRRVWPNGVIRNRSRVSACVCVCVCVGNVHNIVAKWFGFHWGIVEKLRVNGVKWQNKFTAKNGTNLIFSVKNVTTISKILSSTHSLCSKKKHIKWLKLPF